MQPDDIRNISDSNHGPGVSEGNTLEALHRLSRPGFVELIKTVLTEYGLEESLKQVKKNDPKLQILDIGCAEGLYVHDVAQILEERQLLGAAELIGVDINREAIAIAQEYAKVSKPPRPYLKFITYDATQPFEESLDFKLHAKFYFDFIYSLNTLELLPNARQHIERYYKALRPGGVMYFSSLVPKKGPDGWLSAHPGLEVFDRWFFDRIAATNPGEEVAYDTARWLQNLGAVQVDAKFVAIPMGGPTELGRLHLRIILSNIRERTVPALIKSGKLTQAQFDDLWGTLFKELGPHLEGQVGLVTTLARKPLE